MALATLWGLFGVTLLGTVLLLTVTGLRRRPLFWRLPVAVLLLALLQVPFLRGLSPAAYLFGYLGELSVPTVLLLLRSLCGVGRLGSDRRRWLLLLVLLGGAVLYPLSLGPFTWDPYEWGYHPRLLLGVVALAGFLAARRQPAVTVVLALAVLAYGFNLASSTNLWDYLLDPLLVVYALWELVLYPLGKQLLAKARPATR